MKTQIDELRTKIKHSNEPGSYIVTKDGKLEKNLKDEAMKKRDEEKKNKDAALKELTEVTTESKPETKIEKKEG